MRAIHIDYTAEDLAQAYRLHASFAMRRRRVFVLITSIGVMIPLFWFYLNADEGWGVRIIGAAILSVIWYLITKSIVVYQSLIRFPKYARKILSQQKAIRDGVDLAYDESHIEVKTSIATANIKWSDFYQIREGENCFLLYHAMNIYQIVPKRCLDDKGVDFRSCAKP